MQATHCTGRLAFGSSSLQAKCKCGWNGTRDWRRFWRMIEIASPPTYSPTRYHTRLVLSLCILFLSPPSSSSSLPSHMSPSSHLFPSSPSPHSHLSPSLPHSRPFISFALSISARQTARLFSHYLPLLRPFLLAACLLLVLIVIRHLRIGRSSPRAFLPSSAQLRRFDINLQRTRAAVEVRVLVFPMAASRLLVLQ